MALPVPLSDKSEWQCSNLWILDHLPFSWSVRDAEAVRDKMRLLPVVITVSLTVALAYYVYIPLPDGIQEPWKLMLLDAGFRTMMYLVRLVFKGAPWDAWLVKHRQMCVGCLQQVCSCSCNDSCCLNHCMYLRVNY